MYFFCVDVFSQVSDGNGQLARRRLAEYLREALALPAAVYESPSFPYSDSLTETLFPGVSFISYFSIYLSVT